MAPAFLNYVEFRWYGRNSASLVNSAASPLRERFVIGVVGFEWCRQLQCGLRTHLLERISQPGWNCSARLPSVRDELAIRPCNCQDPLLSELGSESQGEAAVSIINTRSILQRVVIGHHRRLGFRRQSMKLRSNGNCSLC